MWRTSGRADGVVPLSAQVDVDVEMCQVFQDVVALPAMVTPPLESQRGGGRSVMTPARYPVPPIPDSSVVMADPLEVTSPAGPAGEGPVVQMLSSPAMSTPEGSLSSGAAAMDQYLPWNGSSFGGGGGVSGLPFASSSPDPSSDEFVSSGGSDVAGGHSSMPDLSREGPFGVLQDRPNSGASPRILDGMQGCQYRITSYDEKHGGPDFTPAYGVQLHDPRLLEYLGAPEPARLLSRSP